MKLLIPLLVLSSLITGCKNNPNLNKDQLIAELAKVETLEQTDKPVIDLPEYYTPPSGAKLNAVYRTADSYKKLDMQKVLNNERSIKLSDLAQKIEYHRITEPIINIRNIQAVPEGYLLTAFNGGLYFYDKNFNMVKKLIEEDISIERNGESYMIGMRDVVSDWCYDSYSGLVFGQVANWMDTKSEPYMGTLSLEELKNTSNILKPDDLKNKIKTTGPALGARLLPLKNGYATIKRHGTTLHTLNTTGDTMAIFKPVEEVSIPGYTIRGAESPTLYTFKNNSYFRMAFTDIIYRIKDYNVFEGVYQVYFGDKQVTPAEGPNVSISLADKLLLHSWFETDNYVLIRFTRDYDCPNTRNSGSVKFYQALYNKKTEEFFSFNNHKKLSEPYNIPNDIDNGIDFWPEKMIDDKPYMIINGDKYKKMLKEKPNHVPVYPDITDDEVILITIN